MTPLGHYGGYDHSNYDDDDFIHPMRIVFGRGKRQKTKQRQIVRKRRRRKRQGKRRKKFLSSLFSFF